MDKNVKTYITTGVLVLVVATTAVGYYLGYRFQNNFSIGKVGTVSITIPLINTSIFVDQSQKIVTNQDNQTVKIPLSPRDHSVIVSHEGYFPWKKDFTVPSNGVINLSPIFITQNASGEIITQNDKDYWNIRNAINADTLPTKDLPRFSADNSVVMWIEDNAILAKVKEKINLVIQPDTVIKNVYFYKDRNDAVMFSTSNAIYMIEINKEGTQNFIPIYKGQNPYFIAHNANSIYVLDGDSLMEVVI